MMLLERAGLQTGLFHKQQAWTKQGTYSSQRRNVPLAPLHAKVNKKEERTVAKLKKAAKAALPAEEEKKVTFQYQGISDEIITYNKVTESLVPEFGHKVLVPRLKHIIIQRGLGADGRNDKFMAKTFEHLERISGVQAQVITQKRNMAMYKMRKGQPAGAMVKLTSGRMYAFVDRLVHLAIPRIRDFRGLNPQSFDGQGNFAMGLSECIMFPEIPYEEFQMNNTGMTVHFLTTAKTDEEGLKLLQALGMPFREAPVEEEVKIKRMTAEELAMSEGRISQEELDKRALGKMV